MIDVFTVSDYRFFFQEWLNSQKKQGRLNANLLAERLAVHPTFISQVLKQHKDFSAEQWLSVCLMMDLSEIEIEFLQMTHQMNRAGSEELRKYCQKKREHILNKRLQLKERLQVQQELTDTDRAVFYSSWIYSAIRLYCSIDEGKTLPEISDRFQITKTKSEEILNFLCDKGLCVINPLNASKYQMGTQHIHVSSDSPFVVRHHTNWRMRVMHTLDQTSTEHLHFTAPISISKKDYHIIREKIVKLIQESVDIVKQSNAEDLATLNIDLAWLK